MHLIGLSIAVGLLFITDLRLADVILKRIPAAVVLQQLLPWVLGGFAAILLSGSLLFMAEASSMLAVLRRLANRESTPPAVIRTAVAISLTVWFGIGFTGRMIGFT